MPTELIKDIKINNKLQFLKELYSENRKNQNK